MYCKLLNNLHDFFKSSRFFTKLKVEASVNFCLNPRILFNLKCKRISNFNIGYSSANINVCTLNVQMWTKTKFRSQSGLSI